ncbi:MAG: LAGLIDADG family homing endonuclease, partial [Candidatus Aenigmatarchaeota archaeon]
FDDDGSVCLGKFQDFITISFYKNKFLVSNLINFLNEVKGILKEIGVNTSKVSYKKTYKNTQEYCFRIYGFKNLKIFYEKIGFNDSIKYQKLFIALKNYIIN